MTAQTILPANSVVDTDIVTNSVRFNDDDGAYMHKTPGSASAAGRRKFTISAWVKRGQTTTNAFIFSAWTADNDAGHFAFGFESAERLTVDTYSTNLLTTNRVFRDPSAWYHVVCAIDTTNGTANNRVRLYVNGVEETSFATRNNPDQNADLQPNNAVIQAVGTNYYNTQANVGYDGYMAEFCMIDNQQLTPTSFGEFDSDSGIWVPINVSGLTFGTNGFYLDFENSANLGNDANGGTDLTEVNVAVTDQSTDTCVNNFATLNPLSSGNNRGTANYVTFSEGNLKVVGNDATNNGNGFSTIGFSSGKWYCEVKVLSVEGSLYPIIGVITETSISKGSGNNGIIGQVTSDTVGYANDGEKVIAGEETSYGDTYTDNDIIGIAIDCDNGAVYFSKNGTFQASGDPTSGSSRTNAAMTFTPSALYFFGISAYKSTSDAEFNFGSPPYAISSGNADADGHGNFEFAVPSGYFALCSKNLAEYG